MNNNTLMALLIGLLVGVGTTAGVMTMNDSESASERASTESMTMDSMVEALEGLEGDEFDHEFLEMMVEHHQAAVDMAQMAERSSDNSDVKELAEDIVISQSKEIDQMNEWIEERGFADHHAEDGGTEDDHHDENETSDDHAHEE